MRYARVAAYFSLGFFLMALSLSAADRRALGNQARIQLARVCASEGDVLGWCKATMPDLFRLPFCPPLHNFLVETRKDKMVSIEAPRGHAKTIVGCIGLTLYQGLVEPDSYRHTVNIQSNDEKSLAVNRTIKGQIESNQILKALYGNQMGSRWTDACFILKNGHIFSAMGTGAGTIRGYNVNGTRPDYIVCDDLYETDLDANSPTNTEKKNGWFWSTLYPALAQDRHTTIRLQGTAVNRYDLFEKLRADTGVKSKTFKAIVDWDKEEVLWPGLKTFAELMQMRERMGTLLFSREFQNERRDDASSIVKLSWLYPDDGSASWEYDPASLTFGEHMQYVAGVVALDPSIGKKVRNDASGYAFVLKGQPSDGSLPRYYIESIMNERHSFTERVEAMKRLTSSRPRERPCTRARVEAISGFRDLGDKIAASVSVPCDVIDRVADKITNLERNSAIFENKRIFINRDISAQLKQEAAYQISTNHPKHDDIRDAILLAIDNEDSNWSSWV